MDVPTDPTAAPGRTVPMASADVAWLRMDNPSNPMTITGVLMLDEPIGRDELAAFLETRLLRFPRFRDRVEGAPKDPRWVATDMDPRDHVIPLRLPEPAGKEELEAAVSALMSRPMDFSKPPWDFHLVENFRDDAGHAGCAIIGRIHHCIADGIALAQVIIALADEYFEPVDPTPKRPRVPLAQRATRTARGALGETLDLVSRPRHLGARLRGVGKVASALGNLLFMRRDADTLLRGTASLAKRAAWSRPVPLDRVKAIGRGAGAKVNDVLLVAAAGALRRYLAAHGEPTEGVELRVAIPFNIRPLERAFDLGNKFGLVFLPLPVGIADPLARVAEIKQRMDAIKASAEPPVVFGILQAIGAVPTWAHGLVVDLFSSKTSAVVTNVPGPQQPLHWHGRRLSSLMFWVPQAGDIGLGISLISFDGTVRLGVAADEALVPDPWALATAFDEEFRALDARFAEVTTAEVTAGAEAAQA